MVEHILAEVRGHFLCLLKATVSLLGLIEGVISTEGLTFSLGVLLQEKWRCCDLVDCACPSHADRHTSLLSVEHHFLHV